MSTPSKSNPLFIIAAISVILFSGTGIATLMGWLPGAHSKEAASAPAATVVGGVPAGVAAPAGGTASVPATPPTDALAAPAALPAAADAPPPAAPATHHHKAHPAQLASAGGASANGAPPPGSAPSAGMPPPGMAGAGVPPPGVEAGAPAPCNACGTVRSVRSVETQGEGSGLGAVAGGVLGAVVGHQVGQGSGNTLATLIGVGGGALAGNAVEKNAKRSTHWEVTVAMAAGGTRVFTYANAPEFSSGDAVRISNGGLVMMR